MNLKYHLIAACVGGLIIFMWGFLVHAALPFEGHAYTVVEDGGPLLAAVEAVAPENGVYMTMEGLFIVKATLPDRSDKSLEMAPYLIREGLIDFAEALMLSFILLWVRCCGTPLGRGCAAALMATAASFSNNLSEWNWYGFSGLFTLQNCLDTVGAWFLTGIAIGWLIKKMGLDTAKT